MSTVPELVTEALELHPPRNRSLVHTRLRASRARWARDGALVGGFGAWSGAAVAAFGLSFHPWLLGAIGTGVVLGGLLGYVGPVFLQLARGRVPLPVLAVALPLVAAAIGTSLGTLGAIAVGAPLSLSATYGAVAAGLLAAVFWLPYTVATVMQLRTWPLVLAACALSPLTGPLTKWLFLAML